MSNAITSRCPSCNGDRYVCRLCRRPWRFSRRSIHTRRKKDGGCNARLRDRVECFQHIATQYECVLCGERRDATGHALFGRNEDAVPLGWDWVKVGPTTHGPHGTVSGEVLACGGCWTQFRVNLDGLFGRGHFAELREQSVACAFAFHLGQYTDAAESEGWNARGPHRVSVGDWTTAAFTDPATLGRFGWGRWSEVRREAQRRPWEPLYETGHAEAGVFMEMHSRAPLAIGAMVAIDPMDGWCRAAGPNDHPLGAVTRCEEGAFPDRRWVITILQRGRFGGTATG